MRRLDECAFGVALSGYREAANTDGGYATRSCGVGILLRTTLSI